MTNCEHQESFNMEAESVFSFLTFSCFPLNCDVSWIGVRPLLLFSHFLGIFPPSSDLSNISFVVQWPNLNLQAHLFFAVQKDKQTCSCYLVIFRSSWISLKVLLYYCDNDRWVGLSPLALPVTCVSICSHPPPLPAFVVPSKEKNLIIFFCQVTCMGWE